MVGRFHRRTSHKTKVLRSGVPASAMRLWRYGGYVVSTLDEIPDGVTRFALTVSQQALIAGATTTPGAGKLPLADAGGKLDDWISAATDSVDGLMSAADHEKLAEISSAEFTLADFSSGNSANTWTDMASAVVLPAIGSSYRRVNLTDVSVIYLNAYQAVAGASTARLAVVFFDGTASPFTWTLADGTTTIADGGTAPSDAASQAMVISSTTATLKKTITVPTAFQKADVTVTLVRWGGDGAADPVLHDVKLTATGAQLAPSLYADQTTTEEMLQGTGVDWKIPTPQQVRVTAEQAAMRAALYTKNTTAWLRWRTVTRLDRDWGSSNVVFDATPDGSSGTNNNTDIKAIMTAVAATGEHHDFLLPYGGVALITKGFQVPDGCSFINPGARGTAGFVTTTTGNETSAIFGLGDSRYPTWASENDAVGGGVSRQVYGMDDDDLIPAGSTQFKMLLADAAVAGAAVGKKLVLKDAWCNTSGPGIGKPYALWVAKIIKKEDSGSYTIITIDEPTMTDIQGDPNPAFTDGDASHFYHRRSTGAYIHGIACHLLDEMPVASTVSANTGTETSVSWATFDFACHGLYLKTPGHVATTGQARGAVWEDCYIEAGQSTPYGNFFINNLWRNCFIKVGARIAEFSMVSMGNLLTDCTWEWNGDATYGGETGTNSALFAFQEESFGNDLHNCTFLGNGWNLGGAGQLNDLLRSLGNANRFRHIRLLGIGAPESRILQVRDNSNNAYRNSWGCEATDIQVEHVATSGTMTNSIIFVRGDYHTVRGVRWTDRGLAVGGAAAQPTISKGTGTIFQDISIPRTAGVVISDSTVVRAVVDGVSGGVQSDGGTSTVKTNATNTPKPERWAGGTKASTSEASGYFAG